MKIFYNTSTGNSLYVAKRILEKLNLTPEEYELLSIPTELKNKNFEVNDEIIGFIYPIHYSGVPIVVYNFLKQLNINNNSYVFAIGVSGGGSSKFSFYQVEKLIKRKLNNQLEVKYISNYIRMGRNPSIERAKQAISNYEEKIDSFAESIRNRHDNIIKHKNSLGKLMYLTFKSTLKIKDKHFNVNDKCISCGMCKKICPMDNITMIYGKPNWNGNCVDCMACINICPKEAINIGKFTINKNRYRNPYISSSELI